MLTSSTFDDLKHSTKPYALDRFYNLPKSLAWLAENVNQIQFYIDQEGFRAVQPSFKLVGHSPESHRFDPDRTTDVVDFMPIRRYIFFFHYAALDSPPIIRRLTINGEESRDYMSRQASLSLKTNGVYTVRGSETSALAVTNSTAETLKLKWKFDYLVDDRRNELTGKVIPGEKTLTPLTFSCSPSLLHPVQGKKINLVHILKKSVVGKLAAEKVEPPGMPTSLVSAPPSLLAAKKMATTSARPANSGSHSANLQPWRFHRRVRSHATKDTLVTEAKSINAEFPCGQPPSTKGVENTLSARRHRRASSACENGQREFTRRLPLQPLPANGQNVTPAIPGQQILPRTQLLALLSAGESVSEND